MMVSGFRSRLPNSGVYIVLTTKSYYLLRILCQVESSGYATAQSQARACRLQGKRFRRQEASMNAVWGAVGGALPCVPGLQTWGLTTRRFDAIPGGFRKGFLMTLEQRGRVAGTNSMRAVARLLVEPSGEMLKSRREVVAGPGGMAAKGTQGGESPRIGIWKGRAGSRVTWHWGGRNKRTQRPRLPPV